jgi:hypothetical protein
VLAGPGASSAVASISISGPASVTEGNAGAQTVTYSVTRSCPLLGTAASVDVGTVAGTATAGSDFQAAPSPASLTFPSCILPTSQPMTVTVTVNGDTLDEADETFAVALSNPSGDTIATGSATTTIIDDDPLPAVSVADARVTEGTGGTKFLAFGVTLSAVSGRAVTVHYATANGTAIAPGDYLTNAGTLTIPAGQPGASVNVPIVTDSTVEPDETFTLTLDTPVNATIADGTATGTILNDDAAPAPPPSTGGGTTTPPTTGGGTTTPTTGGGSAGTDVGFGPGVKPGPTGPDTTAPRVKISKPALAKQSVLRVQVTCPADETTCRGTISIFSVASRKSKVKALRKEVKIGSALFVLPGGESATLTLRLSKRVQKLIRQAKTVPVTAFAVTRDAAGNVGNAQARGTLRRR